MGVDNVRGWVARVGSASASRDLGQATERAPKGAGCPAYRAAVTPAVTPGAMSADSPVERCEAQYFCPLFGYCVVGEYGLVSPDDTR